MASSETSPRPEQGAPAWLEFLTRRRKETAYALFGAAAVAAAIGAWVGYRHNWENGPIWLWALTLGIIALGAGLWQWFREPAAQVSEIEATRLMVLTAGGLAGLVTTVVLGLGLVWQWWPHIAGGWKVWQGEEGWRIWVTVLALVSGLMVMFVSLQLARTETRTSAGLRRLLYGYNAALTGLLLLAILVVLNVLTYLPAKPFSVLSKPYDWTTQSIYSLSPKSENILKSLDRSVRVYVIMRASGELYPRVRALLENCQAVTDRIQVEYLSPEANLQRVEELRAEYKFGDQREGLLVVYGTGSSPENVHFIPPSALVEGPRMMGGEVQAFHGESALISALAFMMENKKRPVLYFTQGNGEPALRDFSRPDGLGQLRQRLEDHGYYQVKGLQLSAREGAGSDDPSVVVAKEVPADADTVVIVRPTEQFPAHALDALREYLNKRKGKLIALLGMIRNPADRSQMKHTGIEELLREFNVQVGDEVVLHDSLATDGLPVDLVTVRAATDSMGAARGPLAGAFADAGFRLILPRTVQSANRPDSPYHVDVLLEVPTRYGPWTQSNLLQLSNAYYLELVKRGELQNRLSRRPVPVAVTVSESDSSVPRDEIHAHLRSGHQKPRLVVIGDGDWVGNTYMAGTQGYFYDLFASCLAWLRERPASIGIEPKKSDVFRWNANTNISRMVWLPAILALVGIIGLGTSVWVVRRR
ncbi:MAG TPA: GldG family protein [Gemmataceae bacterium]|nr:GldG family protein [Gemmataceae bacterium]